MGYTCTETALAALSPAWTFWRLPNPFLPASKGVQRMRSNERTAPHVFTGVLVMAFPIKTCALCGEEFELRPDKPGYANRCPACSSPEAAASGDQNRLAFGDREANAARREAMRNLLYRKDS